MTFKPMGNRIVIKPCTPEKMIGAIHIPETRSARNQTYHHAKVLAAGPKVDHAKVGTTVCVSEFFGDEIELEGEKYVLGSERDITGIVLES